VGVTGRGGGTGKVRSTKADRDPSRTKAGTGKGGSKTGKRRKNQSESQESDRRKLEKRRNQVE